MVRSVARDMAVPPAHEAPGGDPLELPATQTIPTSLVGRIITRRVIAAQLVIDNPPAEPNELSADVHQPTDLIFQWGIALERSEDSAAIRLHEALIHRTTRELLRGTARLRHGARPADGGDPVQLAERPARNVAALCAELALEYPDARGAVEVAARGV
ncbi:MULTISPECIES: hypothetical protein [Nocardia]|uniref:hypothetical protein n=1 Tax=Nocardia TaxID=1817 RepID=UPI002454818B|nr:MULTISPECIES: hypothetical protein [Nocardia]